MSSIRGVALVAVCTGIVVAGALWGATVAVSAGVGAVSAGALVWRVKAEDRKRAAVAEARAARLQTLLQQFFDVVPEPVYIKNAAGQYTMVNAAFCERRNQSAADILGKSLREIEPSPDPRRVEEVFVEDAAVLTGHTILKKEHYRNPKSGEERHRIISKRSAMDADGDPIVIGANFETTRWILAEREARLVAEKHARAQAFLQSVLDAMPIPLCVKDTEHRFLMVNRAHAAWFDRDPDSIIGIGTHALFPAEQAAEVELLERQILDDDLGRIHERELSLSDAQGQHRSVIISAVSAYDAEGQRVILATKTDITDRKKVEQELRRHRDHLRKLVEEHTGHIVFAKDTAERSHEQLSALLTNLSIELRAPMHAILSDARMGESKLGAAPNDKIREYFQQIAGNGDRLLSMLQRAIELSAPHSRHAHGTARVFDLRLLADEIAEDLETLARGRNVPLQVEGKDTALVRGEREKLAQLVRTLIERSIHMSSSGSPVVISLSETVPTPTPGGAHTEIALRIALQKPAGSVDGHGWNRLLEDAKDPAMTSGLHILRAHTGRISSVDNDHGLELQIHLPQVTVAHSSNSTH